MSYISRLQEDLLLATYTRSLKNGFSQETDPMAQQIDKQPDVIEQVLGVQAWSQVGCSTHTVTDANHPSLD